MGRQDRTEQTDRRTVQLYVVVAEEEDRWKLNNTCCNELFHPCLRHHSITILGLLVLCPASYVFNYIHLHHMVDYHTTPREKESSFPTQFVNYLYDGRSSPKHYYFRRLVIIQNITIYLNVLLLQS